jgi:DNA modification methylase
VLTTTKQHYGSFQDSLKAPIHRWFTYPAGYSYKLVQAKISENGLTPQDWIADPFLGCGTTSLTAKLAGLNSLGIEAHPFVFWVAQTKMELTCGLNQLSKTVEEVIDEAKSVEVPDLSGVWPELIYKCFSSENLGKLYSLRQAILALDTSAPGKDLLKLALTATLRTTTSAGAGWPYIAPSKYAERVVQRDALDEFRKHCLTIIADLSQTRFDKIPPSEHRLIQGDAREFGRFSPPESIDLIVTSPPYLNNYDYADRTRLETYFWGIYDNWGDITREVRDKLIIAATTQIRLSQMNGVRQCPGISKVNRKIHQELTEIIETLSVERKNKAGKKTYDLMVAGYFEDMLQVLQGAYTVLKLGRQFALVLGDSAPYGVHVRTDEIIGELAQSIGFSHYHIEVIRTRGGKWAHNTQRHKVPLRESILTVVK